MTVLNRSGTDKRGSVTVATSLCLVFVLLFDIVVYDARWFDQPVIHRVINITKINGTTMYVIKGDNNARADPYYVTADQIHERVLTWGDSPIVIPYIGHISLFLRGL